MSTLSRLYAGIQNSFAAVKSTVMDAGSRIIEGATSVIQKASNPAGKKMAMTLMEVLMDEFTPKPALTVPAQKVEGAEEGGVMGTMKGWLSKAAAVTNDLAAKAKKRVIKEVAMTAINKASSEIQGLLIKNVTSVGEQLGKSATETLESIAAESADAIDTTLSAIGKKFREVLLAFKGKLDTKAQENGISEAEKLGLALANILHEKLSDLGDSCFHAKKISLDAFKAESKNAINDAKPAIEKELGEAFVNFLLNPVITFLKSFVSSLFANLASFFAESSVLSNAPISKPAASVTAGVEEKVEAGVNCSL